MKSYLALFLILATGVFGECKELPLVVNESMTLCSDTYDAPDGVAIAANNIILDCGTAVLRGNRAGRGIIAENKQSITIKNCNIVTFATGMYFKNVSSAQITKNNLVKNDIGIMLEDSYENYIIDNSDKSLQMPVLIIRSKLNTISFENKNVEGSLCVNNACNSREALNPCISFDEYCGRVCSEQSDEDCKPKIEAVSKVAQEVKNYYEDTEKRYNTAAEQVRKLEEEIRKQVPQSENKLVKLRKARIAPMFLIAAVIIGIAVIVVMRNKKEE